MEDRIRLEIGWRQKTKDNLTLRTQRLISGMRNNFCKSNGSESRTDFSGYETAKMLRIHESEVAQEKVEAIAFLHARTLTI